MQHDQESRGQFEGPLSLVIATQAWIYNLNNHHYCFDLLVDFDLRLVLD